MDIAKRTVFMCHNQRRSLVGKARYSWHPIIAIIFSQCQDLLTTFAQIIILVGRGAYIGFKHKPSYSVFTTFFSFKTQTILQIPVISGYHSIQSLNTSQPSPAWLPSQAYHGLSLLSSLAEIYNSICALIWHFLHVSAKLFLYDYALDCFCLIIA